MALSLTENNRLQQPPPTMPRTISFKPETSENNVTILSAEASQDMSKQSKIKKKNTSNDDSNTSNE